MRGHAAVVMAVCAAAVLAGCRRADVSVPRPTGYPRPTLPDTVMRAAAGLPVRLEVNAEATVSSPREGWLDVAYPGLGATMHVTVSLTEPSAVAEVMANRMERAMLNAGDRPGRRREWTNRAGMDVMLIRSEGGSTPLQFLATDDSAVVVSGAVYFADPRAAESADSIRPVTDAVEGDIRRMLDSLRYE